VPQRAPYLTSRLQGFGETIFAEMSALALRTGAINLGQGFPDVDGPAEVSDAAIAAIRTGHNQYPPGIGVRELRHAVSVHQRAFWDLDYDPDLEVLVTAGATEAIAASLLALCEAGDEVLTFEPTYDSYGACAAMAGATLRVVTLRPPDYSFDLADLRAAVTPKTRLVLLNSPHNPTGKVFSRHELEAVARVCLAHDLIAVTDEVYEHLVFEGRHVPLASIPGMRDRTVTISSGGKTFSFTGWKVGWACSSPLLIEAIRTAKQFLTYASGGPFQYGIAAGLGLPEAYFSTIARELREKRDRFCDGLADAGFKVFKPSGTYFVTADIRPFGEDDGLAFCRMLPAKWGVVAVPNVAFYTNRDEGRHLVRFAFCKRLEVLDEAIRRLKAIAT
jgi:N-succinyldiaminopimelate aminotransferase